MPVKVEALGQFMQEQGQKVIPGLNAINVLEQIIPIVVTNPLAEYVAKGTDEFIQRNFAGIKMTLGVKRSLREELKVARAFDSILPVMVMCSAGIDQAIIAARQRQLQFQFSADHSSAPSDKEFGYLTKVGIRLVWGEKAGLTEEEREKLTAPLKFSEKVPFLRRKPEPVLVAHFSSLDVTIWPDQTRIDFYSPKIGEPNYRSFGTDKVLRRLGDVAQAIVAGIASPNHSRIYAVRMA